MKKMNFQNSLNKCPCPRHCIQSASAEQRHHLKIKIRKVWKKFLKTSFSRTNLKLFSILLIGISENNFNLNLFSSNPPSNQRNQYSALLKTLRLFFLWLSHILFLHHSSCHTCLSQCSPKYATNALWWSKKERNGESM